MNIVIVDDEPEKYLAINELVELALLGTDYRITVVDTLSAARQHLRTNKCDVLLLDIRLPQSSGGDARIEIGIDFIAELHSAPAFSIPSYLIVVSAYDEAHSFEGGRRTEGVYAWIRYDADGNSWRDILGAKLKYLSSIYRSQTSTSAYDFDLAIVCALEEVELDAVLAIPWDWVQASHPDEGDPTAYFFGTTSTTGGQKIRVVAAAAPQMGMAATAVLSVKMISKFKPRFVAMPGIAAGVKKQKNLNFGDVLVADLSWDYGSGKMKVEKGKTILAADLRPIPLDAILKAKFVELKRDEDALLAIANESDLVKPKSPLRIHIGPLASGAAVIADESLVEGIVLQQRKLIGIEMEIYGLYYAAANCIAPRPKVFALKSICDYGDRQKTDKYQEYAAYTSARVLQLFVTTKLAF